MESVSYGIGRIGWWSARLSLGACILAWAFAALADAQPPPPPKKEPVYVPPEVGAPMTTSAAATRGQASAAVRPVLLAPAHTGLTSQASPTLYWWLSGDFGGPIELAILDDRRVDSVLEVKLRRGANAGVHALSLAEHRVQLEPGVMYEWSVALVLNPAERSRDIFTSAFIRREAWAGLPRVADRTAQLHAAAREGLWYDAIDLSSRLIADPSATKAARGLRASLLEQVGLREPAAWDRRSSEAIAAAQ
jgi:hypothetical protein